MIKNIKYYFPFNTSKDVYILFFLQVTSQIITSSHALLFVLSVRLLSFFIHKFFSSSVTMQFFIHSSKFNPKVAVSQH